MRTLFLFLALSTPVLAHQTAQEAAQASAERGLAHRGGNPCYEGLGCSWDPETAFRVCCYANSTNLITYDVGIAQSRNGLWVCCRRYVHVSQAGRIPSLLARAGLKRQRTCVADCFDPVKKEKDEDPKEDK